MSLLRNHFALLLLFSTEREEGHTLESHQQLDEKLEQISKLSKVHWAAVVTGRYDLMVEVVFAEPMSDLYKFMTGDLPKVGGIRSSETFMVMKAMRKVVALPRGVKNW
jgi:Lrp/AsnC family transcriptional regulator for asnA, asnC and gidA